MVHSVNQYLNPKFQSQSELFKQPDALLQIFIQNLPKEVLKNLSQTCKSLNPLYFDHLLQTKFSCVEANKQNCRDTLHKLQDLHQNIIEGKLHFSELNEDSKDMWSLKIVGDQLITGSVSYTGYNCRIWDLKSMKCIKELNGHTDQVRCLEVSDGKIYTGSHDCTCRIWDLKTSECLAVLEGHEKAITCIKLLKNKLITGSSDGTCKVWDLETNKCLHTFDKFPHPINYLDADENHLVATSFEIGTCKTHCLQAWNLDTGKKLWQIDGEGMISELRVLGPECVTVGGTRNNNCQILDIESGKCKKQYYPKISGALNCMQVIDSAIIVAGAGQWVTWDLKTGKVLESESFDNHVITKIKVEHNKVFTSSYWNNVTKLWDLKTGKCLQTLKFADCDPEGKDQITLDGIRCLDIRDGKVITGSGSSPVRIWDFNPDHKGFLKELANHFNQNQLLPFSDKTMVMNYSRLPANIKREITANFFKIMISVDNWEVSESDLRWAESIFSDESKTQPQLNQKRAQAISNYIDTM